MIVNKIIDRSETLENYPNRGRLEEDLRSLGKGHRYLLEYHYKIIYKFEVETVIITDISHEIPTSLCLPRDAEALTHCHQQAFDGQWFV